ncbi:MAG: hypothetical protein WAW86_05975 [Gammaproteobacteria bacterium]
MFKLKSFAFKTFALLFAAIAISISAVLPSAAEDLSGFYLQLIAEYTNGILGKVNNLPVYLEIIANSTASLFKTDDTTITGTLQGSFTGLANNFIQNTQGQAALQTNLSNILFVNPATQKTATAGQLPNANDLSYQTMLGQPFLGTDPRGKGVDPMLNYIRNASGVGLVHTFPVAGWRGDAQSQQTYSNFFNTIVAAESYSGYLLSDMYADAKNGSPFTTLQQQLIQQASDPTKWFAKIASEEIGIVLRQILMFESQSFVLLSEMLKIEKQSLYAQAMTNSLLALSTATTEDMLIRKAQGSMPG